jgi:hypothetical protein
MGLGVLLFDISEFSFFGRDQILQISFFLVQLCNVSIQLAMRLGQPLTFLADIKRVLT